jgi:mRNA-degrading endonuclease RelE of RelBE toxin-antitoxin system
LPSSRGPEQYRFEFLPEVQEDASKLSRELRERIAEIVVELHTNPWLGEAMDDRWPQNLEGSRKIRFDARDWKNKPRYRFVYRNEPTDGAVGVMVVLAIGKRSNMLAYSEASARLARRVASAAQNTRRRT